MVLYRLQSLWSGKTFRNILGLAQGPTACNKWQSWEGSRPAPRPSEVSGAQAPWGTRVGDGPSCSGLRPPRPFPCAAVSEACGFSLKVGWHCSQRHVPRDWATGAARTLEARPPGVRPALPPLHPCSVLLPEENGPWQQCPPTLQGWGDDCTKRQVLTGNPDG